MNQSYIFFPKILHSMKADYNYKKNPERFVRGHQNKTNSFSIAQFSHFLGRFNNLGFALILLKHLI